METPLNDFVQIFCLIVIIYLCLRIKKRTKAVQVCKIVHHKDVSAEGIIIIFCMMTAIIVAIKMQNVYICMGFVAADVIVKRENQYLSRPIFETACTYPCVYVHKRCMYTSNNCVVYGWWWKMVWTLWTYQIRFSFQEIVMTFLKGIWYV